MARRPTDRQRLEALLRTQERAIREAFLAAFDRIAASVDRRALLAALERLQSDRTPAALAAALDALRVRDDLLAPLAEAIRGSYVAGGAALLEAIPPSRAIVGFDGRHPRAERWVQENAARRVVEIAADQREAIRAAVLGQVEAGRNPRAIITDIVGRVTPRGREGGIIGLTSQQAGYVANARRQLLDLDAGYFDRVRRDRRFDGLVRRAINEGKPLPQADIDRITRRYQDRLLAYRAEVVSRTESLNALRAGRDEGIRQAVDSGQIRADQITKVWRATRDKRTRDAHAEMDGQRVAYGELFQSPTGAQLAYPGDTDHGAGPEDTIMCRCTVSYSVDFLGG